MSVINLNKEPGVLIGIATSIVIFSIQQFLGGGVIEGSTATTVTNIVLALGPILLQLATRRFTFSFDTVAAILLALGQPTTKEHATQLAETGKSTEPTVKLL